MSRYLLDTNICVALLGGRAPNVFDRLRKHPVNDAAISSITLAELQFGVAKSTQPARHAALLVAFCAPRAIVPFDSQAAQVYGDVRLSLERAGIPIGPLDTLIAAHAVALGVTLVTDNEREFRRVAGLDVENWLSA